MAALQRIQCVIKGVRGLLSSAAGKSMHWQRALDTVQDDIASGPSSKLVSIFSELDGVDWDQFKFVGRCHYLPVYQDPSGLFDIAAFYLAAGARLPLHGHPNQTVFTKVLSGNLAVASFDFLDAERIRPELAYRIPQRGPVASFHGTSVLGPSGWTWLEPQTRNIHEFMALHPDQSHSQSVFAACEPPKFHSTTLRADSAATPSLMASSSADAGKDASTDRCSPGALVIDLVVPPYLTSWQSNGDPPIQRICPYFSVQRKASVSGVDAVPLPLRQGDTVEVRPAAAAEGHSRASTEHAPSWFDTPRHLPVEAQLQLPVDPDAM